jgi:lysyl-tRNA synthetase class 1
MQWLNTLVDEIIARHPDGEILVSSGVSPSGTYHLGTLREVLTAEVIMRELKRRGRPARHVHVVDDLDIFRKVPVDVPAEFEQHLGKPLCDVPAPDGSDKSYADYFLQDLLIAARGLHLEMDIMRAHQEYRAGYFVPAIEKALLHLEDIKKILEDISGRKLDEQWSPVQVVEDGYLKNRRFIAIDPDNKTLTYEGKGQQTQTVSYANGEVKLNWRIDWPARWWLLGVSAEPFGRDHATKGGSYDTGAVIAKQIFDIEAPVPVPYHFINRTGDTKKMSKSAGDTVTASDLLQVLPPELVWFFVIRFAPEKQLFFDQGPTLMRLFDEFGELLAKPDKSPQEEQLLELCLKGVTQPTISRIPFTHLVASYQAALRDPEATLDVIRRTEHAQTVEEDGQIIRTELQYIDAWLDIHAPDEVKFTVIEKPDFSKLTDIQTKYLADLADKISQAPADADGEWFHKTIYAFKESGQVDQKTLFTTLYQVLIGKDAGPRAGWFLSSLPRDWLIARLRQEK